VLDPAAEPVMLTHPITDEPLLDEAGEPLRASDAKQVALKDVDAGEPVKVSIAWPWYAPIGGGFALVLGYLLADRREDEAAARVEPVGSGVGG
jgi:hypothetical protein